MKFINKLMCWWVWSACWCVGILAGLTPVIVLAAFSFQVTASLSGFLWCLGALTFLGVPLAYCMFPFIYKLGGEMMDDWAWRIQKEKQND